MIDKALGMIATRGIIALIAAPDAAVKAAAVEAVDYDRSGGGLVIIKIRGTVAAVTAAVEAGSLAAQRIGEFVCSHVIPNPDDEVEPMITPAEPPTTRKPAKEFHRWSGIAHGGKMIIALDTSDEKLVKIIKKLESEGAQALDYNELRYFARRIDNFPLEKSKIRNAGRLKLAKIIDESEIEIKKQ